MKNNSNGKTRRRRVATQTKAGVGVKVVTAVAFSVIVIVGLGLSVATFAVQVYRYAYADAGLVCTNGGASDYNGNLCNDWRCSPTNGRCMAQTLCGGTCDNNGKCGYPLEGCVGSFAVRRDPEVNCTQDAVPPETPGECFSGLGACQIPSCVVTPPAPAPAAADGVEYCIPSSVECVDAHRDLNLFEGLIYNIHSRGIAVGQPYITEQTPKDQINIQGGQDYCLDDYSLVKTWCVPPMSIGVGVFTPAYLRTREFTQDDPDDIQAKGLLCADGAMWPCAVVKKDGLHGLDTVSADQKSGYQIVFVPSGFSPSEMPRFVGAVKKIVAEVMLNTQPQIYDTPQINFYVISHPTGASPNWITALKQYAGAASDLLFNYIKAVICHNKGEEQCKGTVSFERVIELVDLISPVNNNSDICFTIPVPIPNGPSMNITACLDDVATVVAAPYCRIDKSTPPDRVIPVILRNSTEENTGFNVKIPLKTDTDFTLNLGSPININLYGSEDDIKKAGRYARNMLNNYIFKLGDIRWPQDDGKIDFSTRETVIQSLIQPDRDFWGLPEFSLNNQLGIDLSANRMKSIYRMLFACVVKIGECVVNKDPTCRDDLLDKVKDKCGSDVFKKITDKAIADVKACNTTLKSCAEEAGTAAKDCFLGCKDQVEGCAGSFDPVTSYIGCDQPQECGSLMGGCDWNSETGAKSCFNACADLGNGCAKAYDISSYDCFDDTKSCITACNLTDCLTPYKDCLNAAYQSSRDSLDNNDCLKDAAMDAALGYCAENLAPADGKACVQSLYNNFLGWQVPAPPNVEGLAKEEKTLKQLDYYFLRVKDVVNSCTLYSCSRWEQYVANSSCVYNVGLGGITTAPENTGMMFNIAGSDTLNRTDTALACCLYKYKYNVTPDFCKPASLPGVDLDGLCNQQSVQDIFDHGEGWNAAVAEFLRSADSSKQFLINTVNGIKLKINTINAATLQLDITFINSMLQEELDKVTVIIDDGKAQVIDFYGDPASNDPDKVHGLISGFVRDEVNKSVKDYLTKKMCVDVDFFIEGACIPLSITGGMTWLNNYIMPIFKDPKNPVINSTNVDFR